MSPFEHQRWDHCLKKHDLNTPRCRRRYRWKHALLNKKYNLALQHRRRVRGYLGRGSGRKGSYFIRDAAHLLEECSS